MAVSDIPPKFVEHFYVAQHKNILNIFVSAVGSIHESTDSNGRCLFILFDIILMYLHFKNKSNKFKYTSILAVATPRVLPRYAHSVIQQPYECVTRRFELIQTFCALQKSSIKKPRFKTVA